MPSANVKRKEHSEDLHGTRWLITSILALIVLVLCVTGWGIAASVRAATAAADAACLIGEHVASDEAGDRALGVRLKSMEARQIQIGTRIDGIYERLGE